MPKAAVFSPLASVRFMPGSDPGKRPFSVLKSTGSLSNVESVVGGSGTDTVTLATQISNGSIDLANGLAKFTVSYGDNVTCTFINSNIGTTRTQGFGGNHAGG